MAANKMKLPIRLDADGDSEIVYAERGQSISSLLHLNGIVLDSPCGGDGRCGRCRVKVEGGVSSPDGDELAMLGEYYSDGWRLACKAKIMSPAVIYVNELKGRGAKSSCSGSFAAAIDIGTTTVAVYIVDKASREVADSYSIPNPGREFGADVITRAMAAAQGKDVLIKERLASLINAVRKKYGVDELCITGNTVMLHLLHGLDTSGFCRAPFSAVSLFGEIIGDSYFPPCISPFVGADSVTAALYSGIFEHKSAMLVDIGTNGEIMLWAKGECYTTSTSAGPAFECADISCGMTASRGAIAHFEGDGSNCRLDVIGGGKPIGICGSGLVDIAAYMLEYGIMQKNGYLPEAFRISDGISINQDDVRALQTAKAAIRSGIDCLLARSGITVYA